MKETRAPATLPAAVEDYIARQRSVDGWLSKLDARMIAQVGRFQMEHGIPGSVGEIGVHHGRLFILLALLMRPGERSFALDIFEQQHLNLDRSGQGDEAVFRRNLGRFGVLEQMVGVIRGSSTETDWARILPVAEQPARLFSIDGGHTAEITANDLAIADVGLAPAGVVILDDYFNAEYPAVSEGLCRYLIANPGRLVPCAIGDNKLLLCRPDQAEAYREFLVGALPRRHFVHRTRMFGCEVAIFRTARTLLQRVRQSRLTRRLTDNPMGRRLKPVVRRVLDRG